MGNARITARALLAGRAFEEAAKQAWYEVHREGNRESALVAAAAYLWADDFDNARVFLDVDNGPEDAYANDLVQELLLLRLNGVPSRRFAGVFEKALLTKSYISSFAIPYLIKQAPLHGWSFAPLIDWGLLPFSERDTLAFVESLFATNADIGARVLAQYLGSDNVEALNFLPPEHCVSAMDMSTWSRLLHESGVPKESLFYSIIEHGRSAEALVRAPRDLLPEEIDLAIIHSGVYSAEYPSLFAQLLVGVAKKSEYSLPTTATLKIYRAALEHLPSDNGTYFWLRREVISKARLRVNQPPLPKHELDGYTPESIRLLILACAAVHDDLSGVLLAEFLRREQPDRPSSVMAGWMSLFFNAPEWSALGFKDLGYVAPEHASAYPVLSRWPYRPLPAEALEPWLKSAETWPLISVVVPSYQQGHFLEQTLLSLLNQGYPNLEIIVEDGGSTDSTAEVLATYADRLAFVRSGPDGGQSAALNDGFRKATGEILGWLNSDDMLAPLALFHIAEAYRNGGELLVGACFEFKDNYFVQVNLPSLPSGPLEQRPMADLKDRWFMGHYFYQPEVFFSADAYRRAGEHINADLHYTMDYDLWMRFAGIGAVVSKVKWPVALFRRHEEQKTSNLDRTVIEQGNVRKSYVDNITDGRHIRLVRKRLTQIFAKDIVKVLVVTGKYGRFFPVGFEEEVRGAFKGTSFQVDFVAAKPGLDLNRYDLILLIVTLTPQELDFLRSAKANSTAIIAGWFWDNHHMFRENLEFASLLDIGLASHDFAKAYLESKTLWLLESRLISYTQWSAKTFATLGEYQQRFARSSQLYGGFVAYPDAPDRANKVNRLKDSGYFPNLKLIDPNNLGGYYSMTEADKFIDWCKYKVSLCANVERDVPIRFFDALVTGQIPVLPSNALDIPLLRAHYPEEEFVVCDTLEPEDVRVAWRRAVEIYDQAGPEGVVARTSRAMALHSFQTRLAEVLGVIKSAATS